MPLSDLFKPRWRHSRPEVRLAAVDRLPPHRLGEVLRRTGDDEVFLRALARLQLSDDELLTLFERNARCSGDNSRAFALLARIHDQGRLARIAIDSVEPLALAALARITDDKERARVVRRTGKDSVQRTAFAAITSRPVLRDLARADTPPAWLVEEGLASVGPAVPDWLTDEVLAREEDTSFLASIVGRAQPLRTRQAAERRLAVLLPLLAEAGRWADIEPGLVHLASVDLHLSLLTRLPPERFNLKQLSVLAERRPSAKALQPLLDCLPRDRWRIQSSAQETPCHECSGAGRVSDGRNSAFENEVYVEGSHVCGSCGGSGRGEIQEIVVSSDRGSVKFTCVI